jgi:hypothetical protein
MRNLRNLVVGFSLGIVASATLAWALEVKIPPRITAKANLVVDEAGNALFGATPGKVEMVNCPTAPTPPVLTDGNGATVGTVLAGTPASGPVYVVRDIAGVGVAIGVPDQFTIEGTAALVGGNQSFYYTSTTCSGTAYMVSGGSFYPASLSVGGILYYEASPPTPRDINSYRLAANPSSPCNVNAYSQLPTYVPATFDLTQFVPPFHVGS